MLILTSLAALAMPPADATWKTLLTEPVLVECTTAGTPYCRSTGVIGVPVATAADTFSKLDQYVSKMESISAVTRLAPDTLHVVMDYPFPLTDRDYVAQFTRSTLPNGGEVFAWVPVTHASAPVTSDALRLTWLDGEWRFEDDKGDTRVTYIWQSNPGGNLPDAGAVYKTAGKLAVTDIANACSTKILRP